ncbi:unnamed protein product [marine sediment metagenome]|uniref:Uncharacterized protein n=1 Tax=marine sediment metagenome TaxID=412755 RepID=X1E610_9ZZZZ
MSYSVSEDNEENNQLRELTSEYVFCPKCGTKNNFSSASKTQTSFFCLRCSSKIGNYWENYLSGKILTFNCELCSKLTFKSLKYCISCGEINIKTSQIRSEIISEKVTSKRSRFFSNKIRLSFLLGAVLFVVGGILAIVGFIQSFGSYYIIYEVLIYIGVILVGASIALLTIVPVILIIRIARGKS